MRKSKSNAMLRGLAASALVLMVSATAWGQKVKITGTVIDNTNEPVIGASVLENGTKNGVATDLDGHFTIEVQPGARLKISYIGYKNKEVKASNGVQIMLEEESNMLNEVVAIGYGSVKRKDVTTAVSSVSAKDLDTRPIVSAAAGMQGKAAGLQISQANGQPGASPTIRVRGTTSLNGSNDPLYVVDGVPMTNIDFLAADDIDNIQVLKDASSAAIYGSRAANGVIIITTKKGKEGKTHVNYDMQMGWSNIAKKSAFETMNSAELKEYWTDAVKNYFEMYPNALNAYYPGMDASSAALAEIKSGYFNNYDSNETTDWYKEIYRTGFTTDHQISIDGGNDRTKFFTSFGYNKVNGTVKGSSFDRYSGRLNLDHKVTDWFKVSAKEMLSFTNTSGFRDQGDQAQGFGTSSPMSVLFSMDPTAKVKNEDGTYNASASFSSTISNPNLMYGDVKDQGDRSETLDAELMRSLTNVEGELKLPYDLTLRSI